MSSVFLIMAVIIIIVAIVVLGPLITRRLSIKVNLFIIGGYLAVLFMLTVVCLLIPPSALKTPLQSETVSQYNLDYNVFTSNLKAGNFYVPEGYTKTENAYKPQTDSVAISADIFGMAYVGIKGVDVPDNGNGKIDVYSYVSGNVIFGNSYYEVQPDHPEIYFEDGVYPKLDIGYKVGKQTLKFYRFDDRYTVQQFSDADFSWGGGSYISQILIVLLPPDVEYSGTNTEPLSSLLHSAT